MKKEYFGINTQKAKKNFPFSFRLTYKDFVYNIARIKKAAAIAHNKAGELNNLRKQVIVKACDEILSGKLDDQFVLPSFQGGAGTSNHMNVNEVIAGKANELLQKMGKNISVHPNDHVNMSQSTNDVMPTAARITALLLNKDMLTSLELLIKEVEKKAKEFKPIAKLGRTHMQDAVPVSLGSEFEAFAENLRRAKTKVVLASQNLHELNLGGSAVGNSINVSKKYIKAVYPELSKLTKLELKPGKNLMALTSSTTDFVFFAQSLTTLTLELSKIANDLRMLASGPNGGVGEIILPELQAGSSIMPGKVNPVLPEAMNQLYFLVSGNGLTIEHASQAAQLQLNVMLPVLTDRLVESLKLTNEMLIQFASKCVSGIKANKRRCKENLEKSTAYATLLSPKLGYDTVSRLVKQSVKEEVSIKELVLAEKLITISEFNDLVDGFIHHNI